jgi:alkanesulfonate monooxygenase SsuD/methylene tetrahydromethanopterin reductase-like flavin-dependent oxidoreductase (luciferase family)
MRDRRSLYRFCIVCAIARQAFNWMAGTLGSSHPIDELGLFDYLAWRFAVYGTPEECRAQMAAAQAARRRRVVFTVSLAADPVAAVELFGSEVLPELR